MESTLVRWSERHAARLRDILNDVDVTRYLTTSVPFPYSIDDANEWIARQGGSEPPLHFGIEYAGELVGGIGVSLESGHRAGSAMIGYYLGKRWWGRGIMTSAVLHATSYAFELPGVVRVYANVFGPNAASMRVLSKAGFHHDATMPMAIVDRYGNRVDEHFFSILRATPTTHETIR